MCLLDTFQADVAPGLGWLGWSSVVAVLHHHCIALMREGTLVQVFSRICRNCYTYV